MAKWERKSIRIDNQEVGLEAATLERVRNSSLVECERAPIIYRGSSLIPKLWLFLVLSILSVCLSLRVLCDECRKKNRRENYGRG